MYICMLEVSIFAFVAKIFGLEFGTVLAVWYTTFFLFYAHLILIHFFQSNVTLSDTGYPLDVLLLYCSQNF